MFQPFSSGGLSTGLFGRRYKVSGYDVVLACAVNDDPPMLSRYWTGYLEREGEVMEALLDRMEEEGILRQNCEWEKIGEGMRFTLLEKDIQTVLAEIQTYLDSLAEE